MINKVPLLFSLFFAFTVVFFGLFLGLAKDASKSKTRLILYLLVTGLLLSLSSLAGLIKFIKLPLSVFIAAQAFALIVGSLHSLFFEKIVPVEKNDGGRILFALAVCCFGYGLIVLSYKLFFKSPFPAIFLLPALFFIAPTFISFAFKYFVLIPGKVFKVWSFPVPGTLSDPSDNEMADPIIVNFEIRKKSGESHTLFKAKAPRGMKLGRLFYFFIMDYNSRHPDNPITISEDESNTFKWSFCLSAGFLSGEKRLDPEMSISENGIKENASVICERILL
jgi:hypothetical protein